jgi:putative photosynthetic complex assembly protein 2
MSDHAAAMTAPLDDATTHTATVVARESSWQLWRRGIALVVVFWWVATGLIIAMQRSGATRAAAFVLATGLALLGWREIRVSRDDHSPLGVRRSFLGGALLWGWISVLFYGGLLTGIVPAAAVAAAPSWSAVPAAIGATLWSDLGCIALMLAAIVGTRGAVNRTGMWALVIFWGVQQVAKLNVFFGVENPAANFLPPHLSYLGQFFGPPVNSLFLALSIAAVSVSTLLVAWRGRAATENGDRQAMVLYATILALAVLELMVLGIPLETTPWDSFLKVRGG